MEKTVSLFILILCGIFSQGICNVYQENSVDAEESSDLQIRRKRMVGGLSISLDSNPYLVSVLENGNYHCPANLLTADVAISSATCFKNRNTQYMRITSRSLNGADYHVIVRVIFLDPNFNPARPTFQNLALVRFAHPILFQNSYNRPITIYSGSLAVQFDNVMSRVVSWASPISVSGRMIPSEKFLVIGVQAISINYCQNLYPHIIGVGNICTVSLQPGAHSENRDSGSPLIHNHLLLGIFVYRGNTATDPDVSMNLLDNNIRRWIHEHVPSLRLF